MLAVSVVIPTIGHAELGRAVRSVLAQTHEVREVLVVADTDSHLDLPADERVKLLRVGPGAGGNVARQAGIANAHGDVIALLDDDDEWLPDRLAAQFAAVARAGLSVDDSWIATSRVTRVAGDARTLLPSAPLGDGEDVRRYLFVKRSPRSDHGFIQASTLLFPRHLALAVPFDPALRFHQDISWLLDVIEHVPKITFIQVWEPLVNYYSLAGSVSKRIDPLESVLWARHRLSPVSSRVLGDFILTQSLGFARRIGARPMVSVLWRGIRYGRPGIAAVVYATLVTTRTAMSSALGFRRRKERSRGSS